MRHNKSMIKQIIDNRKLLWSLAKNDFKTKYAGSYLGRIWGFIQPIITVLVYWFAFEKGLKVSVANLRTGMEMPFVLWLTAGIIPWFFFSDALVAGTSALREYNYLVKKVVFNIEILPTVRVISALFTHLFFVGFGIAFLSCYKLFPDLYTLQVIYYSVALFILVIGLVYATSAIMVFFQDLGQIVNIILQVGIWLTPIMWDINKADFSPVLMMIIKLNPLLYIVEGYRDALINKVWFWQKPELTIYYWCFTIVVFLLGTRIFEKLKLHFADVL